MGSMNGWCRGSQFGLLRATAKGMRSALATVNRWRSTLRKALRMARRWKVLQTVPEIPRLKGERERSFVFTETLRKKYEELAPEPLNSFIQFSCEIGICEGEIIDLLKADVHMTERADEWGHYGYLQIRKGKSEFRKRSLPITARAKDILTMWGMCLHPGGSNQPNFSFYTDPAARTHEKAAESAMGRMRA
jgi:hypothetical protein